ncbi:MULTISPECIES: class I SAM-dependent methyltransferase [unclassified Rhizobacter]|uniref:class I SAM-dependent methyltransferase n=1 Tax=unclassified Rhizobacter TaxID=2640088 RepID=UPI0009EA4D54|nr:MULTISPECIES: class I SAM-dependent methyltransferase [unclassified Rhizobacter]
MVWPLPALLAWSLAWALFLALRRTAVPPGVALLLATALGGLLALLPIVAGTSWRRIFVALGFPLSLLASGVASALPAWTWLLPMGALISLYPVHAWRDAPVFPTPRGALRGLSELVPLPAGARVLDAGCGLGDGLRELHAAYPHAMLDGIEWSWPVRLLCGLRCRLLRIPARVTRGDIWKADWSGYELVYLFQRPESMPRAVAKARQELRPGAWMASLEFEALELRPVARHLCPDGRPVWLYQVPFKGR